MIELPEAVVLARQLTETVHGKVVERVVAGHSPHKFAWYSGDPATYDERLRGKALGTARSYGGLVELEAGEGLLVFADGVSLRFHTDASTLPKKHQLLLELTDGTFLTASVQMYGGMWCLSRDNRDNHFHAVARRKPSPLTDAFDSGYFATIVRDPGVIKLSAKALLATEQRIPGLGNGVLQDILFNARVHPRTKVRNLDDEDMRRLFRSIPATLRSMLEGGGRNTERDLFGAYGGYETKLSKKTVGTPCRVCGSAITKQAYLGGSVYFCPTCQRAR
jgi:formamidopyrimidine-DNA glycosylase